MLITTLSQLNILEQLLRSVLLFEEKREKDLINDMLIQLLTDLLPEELLNEARHFYVLFQEVLVYLMIIFCIKSNL